MTQLYVIRKSVKKIFCITTSKLKLCLENCHGLRCCIGMNDCFIHFSIEEHISSISWCTPYYNMIPNCLVQTTTIASANNSVHGWWDVSLSKWDLNNNNKKKIRTTLKTNPFFRQTNKKNNLFRVKGHKSKIYSQ